MYLKVFVNENFIIIQLIQKTAVNCSFTLCLRKNFLSLATLRNVVFPAFLSVSEVRLSSSYDIPYCF